jgi:hypothetical protein
MTLSDTEMTTHNTITLKEDVWRSSVQRKAECTLAD